MGKSCWVIMTITFFTLYTYAHVSFIFRNFRRWRKLVFWVGSIDCLAGNNHCWIDPILFLLCLALFFIFYSRPLIWIELEYADEKAWHSGVLWFFFFFLNTFGGQEKVWSGKWLIRSWKGANQLIFPSTRLALFLLYSKLFLPTCFSHWVYCLGIEIADGLRMLGWISLRS